MADEKDGTTRTAKAAATRGRARSAQSAAVVSVVRNEPAQVPAQTRSGVVPVLFSASAEAHDVAVVAADSGAEWRSPFGAPLRPASGE